MQRVYWLDNDCERYLDSGTPKPPIDVSIHPATQSYVCCAKVKCKAPFVGSFCRNADKAKPRDQRSPVRLQTQGFGSYLNGYWVRYAASDNFSNYFTKLTIITSHDGFCPAGSLCFVMYGDQIWGSPSELPLELDPDTQIKSSDKNPYSQSPNLDDFEAQGWTHSKR